MTAYYNEIDPYTAQWLRNLISAGHIAPGDVDERSIEDVHPDDIRKYTQCHFFAGVGVWSHSLRRAGWPDDRPVWTGSCPCQPFSAAGKGAAFADERHLWPAFHHLIKERRPATVFGEQVASKDADAWIDLVQADLETMGYAVGAIPFPAAGVGAPHIRDRLYWVADSSSTGLVPSPHTGVHRGEKGARARDGEPERHSDFGWLGHTDDEGLERHTGDGGAAGRGGEAGSTAEASVFGWLADPDSEQRPHGEPRSGDAHAAGGREQSAATATGLCSDSRPSPLNGFWRDADWLLCRDGKWRPVEPGTFPLAHGITNRVGRLRAYGNAICAEAAIEFIKIAMEYRP